MKSILLPIFILFGSWSCFSQGRLVIIDNGFLVLTNNAKVVVENPATNAITSLGTGANILTESEFNQVVWQIGTNTGSYTVPFTSQTTFTKIPFSAMISAAGSGAGAIRFSTYPGNNWDNDTYRPSDVTHMFDYFSGSFNNSLHVIDRFWIIDAIGYTTKPTATFDFTYRDLEHLQIGNTILESDLGAQRFNNSTNQWGDYLPSGVTNILANTTSGVPVSPANFFRSWTLSEVTFPLAAEINYFKSVCGDDNISFEWETATEQDVDRFEIEFFRNGAFEVVGSIPSMGNSSTPKRYTDHLNLRNNGIYRLIQVDFNGARQVKQSISVDCDMNSSTTIWESNNQLNIATSADHEENSTLIMLDMSGKIVLTIQMNLSKGKNNIALPIPAISNGMYMVRFKNGTHYINEKVLITKQ